MALNANINLNVPPQIGRYKNSLVEAVLLLIVSVLFYWFIVSPKNADLAVKKDNLVKIQEQESKLADATQKFEAMVKDLQSHKKEITDLDQALPLEGDQLRMQILLESLANSINVTIGSINVSSQSTAPWSGNKALLADPFAATRTLQTLSGTVFVTGSFDQLVAFLQKLENNGRVINVTAIGLDAGAENKLNLKLSFDAYFLAP
ncbi:MAG: hypothetical protein HY918_03905 [Candidatus Doudnabacteria bacterium]|nr:hypothetical protein [Candidatus Doudnabacteria bacterium]